MFQWLSKYIVQRAVAKEKGRAARQMKESMDMQQAKSANIGYANAVRPMGSVNSNNGITFRLNPGIGGYTLNVSRYDSKTDNHEERMYVIPEGGDLGDEISKIITLEGLRS